MSDTQHDAHEAHTGPIKTPKQLVWAVVASFVVPIIAIILLVNYVAMGDKTGAGSRAMDAESVAQRIAPVGRVELRDASDAATLKSGEEVYKAACTACHSVGAAGAPKTGDAAAWAPRIAQGKATLYKHSIEGFQGSAGVMPAKGGRSDISDELVQAAVDYMAGL